MSESIGVVTDATFKCDVLDSKGLVLVDFWAEWCAPCKSLLPTIDELAKSYAGEVKVVKVNADENKASGEQFSVRGLPTLVLLRDGVEVERVLGMTSKTRLAALFDKHLEA